MQGFIIIFPISTAYEKKSSNDILAGFTKIKGIFEILLMGNPLLNPLLDIGMHSTKNTRML